MDVYNRFGYEWSTYPNIIPLYECQFLTWVQPLQPNDFDGLRVLDAGCGTGRNSIWPLRYGAKEVVAFDVDPRSVTIARRNLAHFSNVRIDKYSIYEMPYDNEFDLAISIGVIHHLADPRKAVANLVRAIKPAGRLLIWVYGKEGHTGLKKVVNAARRITCRLPAGLLNVVIKPLSFLWWTYIKLGMDKHSYHRLLRPAPFWHIHSILFDQLLPEISNYWTKEELLELFSTLPLKMEHVTWVNEGSWTVVARKNP